MPGLGFTPFGCGTPVAAAVPPTGTPGFSRYLNPSTGDLEVDSAAGGFVQTPALRQRVMLILATELGSSTALPDLGIKMPGKLDPSAVTVIKQNVATAFKQLTTVEKVMRIDGIDVEKTLMGRVRVTLSYTDLAAPQVPQIPAEAMLGGR